MKFRILLTVVTVWSLCGSMAVARDSTLIQFEMKDQFDFEYRDTDFRGRVLLVLVGDKKGGKFSRTWSPALRDSLPAWGMSHQVRMLSVADVGGVPFFLKGLVRGKMPKTLEDWMLMDWGGEFAKAYECVDDVTNVLIFDEAGSLRHTMTITAFVASDMQTIQARLMELVGAKAVIQDTILTVGDTIPPNRPPDLQILPSNK